EQSMVAFAKEQERFRQQVKDAIGKAPIGMMPMAAPLKGMEELTRRNAEMFQDAMRLFTPFPVHGMPGASAHDSAKTEEPTASDRDGDLSELKEQIAAMQRKIDQLGK